MAKKERIELNRPGALTEIDAELDAAMDRLDGANVRIDELLTNFKITTQEGPVAEHYAGEDDEAQPPVT